jgi:hypothetical protein
MTNMTVSEADRACDCTHGTVVEHLLSLIPAPSNTHGDPFLVLSPRAAKAWLALFWHARQHGSWQARSIDPARPELTEDQEYILGARWTVAGLAFATGTNRDTAGKAIKELASGGWIRREDQRSRGQFGGIDYAFCTPATITQADKVKVVDGLRKRGVEFVGYKWRTAARILEEADIKRVQEDVLVEIATEQADLAGDEEKAIELVSQKIIRLAKGCDHA